MSNMIFACSIYQKFKIPMILTFNKIDIADYTKIERWFSDFDNFIGNSISNLDDVGEEKGYLSNLSRSIGFELEEFYCHFAV